MCAYGASTTISAEMRRTQRMKYIKRSEDTEQINVVSWAHWKREAVFGIEMAVPCTERWKTQPCRGGKI